MLQQKLNLDRLIAVGFADGTIMFHNGQPREHAGPTATPARGNVPREWINRTATRMAELELAILTNPATAGPLQARTPEKMLEELAQGARSGQVPQECYSAAVELFALNWAIRQLRPIMID